MVLLHAGDVALRTARLEWPVIALGFVVLVLVMARIWTPRLLRRTVRRSARRAAAPLAAVAVTLAVLPLAIPYDHLTPDAAHSNLESEVHASHCHTAPGSCSDAPATSGPGLLLDAAPLVLVPAMLLTLIAVAAPLLAGISWRPEVPPPLRLRAAA